MGTMVNMGQKVCGVFGAVPLLTCAKSSARCVPWISTWVLNFVILDTHNFPLALRLERETFFK